jgi:predicted Zn-ribbon and HTH transcriptional regulator
MSEGMKNVNPPAGMLGARKFTVFQCTCRCGHVWISRDKERPRVCPKCKSPNWDRPKLYERDK